LPAGTSEIDAVYLHLGELYRREVAGVVVTLLEKGN